MRQRFKQILDEVEPIAIHACVVLCVTALAFLLGKILHFLKDYASGHEALFKNLEIIEVWFYTTLFSMFAVYTLLRVGWHLITRANKSD